ncbi:MAG: helix-turn-helix transcriptional regulator [Actinomycetota bacterium]
MSLLEFRLRIRKRRDELGLTAEEVRKHLGVSRVYFSSIENGRATLADNKLDPLLSVLSLEDQREELGTLLEGSRERGWWHKYSRVLDPVVVEFCGLEWGASRVRLAESRVAPGLLQTSRYAEVLIRRNSKVSRHEVATILETREHRQARLKGPDSADLFAVVSETVLMQHYGGSEVLAEQIDHLLSLTTGIEPAAHLRVQPFNVTPLNGAQFSTSQLFDFLSPHIPTVAVTERTGVIELLFDDDEVRLESLNFELYKESAASSDTSAEMLRRRLDQLQTEL